MAPAGPQLLSIALLVREDRKTLFVQHAGGSFPGRWSPPLIGVADTETAEDALERLLRTYLDLRPGTAEFMDTLYLEAGGGERFIANVFTSPGWQGTPRFPGEIFQDAIWMAHVDADSLDLVPEVREWLAALTLGGDGAPEALRDFDASDLLARLADSRGDLLAAFDAVPAVTRRSPLDEGGWNALDVLAHVADTEAYYMAELRRCLDTKGRAWSAFNSDQWWTTHRLRPLDQEDALRDRMEGVRSETRSWLTWQPPAALEEYLNHPVHGVVQAGNRIEGIAAHDREHTEQLRRMAETAAAHAAEARSADDEEAPL